MAAMNRGPLSRQDRNKHDVYVTSKHRSTYCVEWSKLSSRDTPPFFQPRPQGNNRGLVGAEPPRRHTNTIDFEKAGGRGWEPDSLAPGAKDERDYTLHNGLADETVKHSRVNIGRTAPRPEYIFGHPQHESCSVVDPIQTPGWVRGTKRGKTIGSAPRDTSASLFSGAVATESKGVSLPQSEMPKCDSAFHVPIVSAKYKRTVGGDFARGPERQTITPLGNMSETPDAAVKYDFVEKNVPIVNMSRQAPRPGSLEKNSTKYKALFNQPPGVGRMSSTMTSNVTASPERIRKANRARTSLGFAYQRSSFRNSVEDVLATADADRKRAQATVSNNFTRRLRSGERSALMFTPSPSHSPISPSV